MTRLARPLDQLADRYDAIVVGSGYGGGVAALRLAQAGRRVCVLERGREVQPGEFPARFPELRTELRVTGGRLDMGRADGLYDVRLGPDMHVVVGCGLGGGSLVNAGVALRPEPHVFADEAWPGQIRQDGLLDEGYRRAEAWLRPARDPQAAGLTKYRALARAGRALALDPVASRITASFEETVNAAGLPQPACTRCGDCCGGCNVGAKTTVAATYLAAAHRHGAAIFTGARVTRVVPAAGGAWQVELAAPAGGAAARAVTAPVVVLAAGTLGSTEILLRARAAGLALSDRLGQRFSANGDIIAFGYGAGVPVNGIGVGHPAKYTGDVVGAAVSGQLEVRGGRPDEQLNIQEGVMPSALAAVLPVMFVPNGRLLGALQSLIAGVYQGPFRSLQTFFAVSHDSASGRFVLEGDRLVLAWPGARDEPVYKRLDEALGRIVGEVGGSYVRNPLAGTVMGQQPATAHPLGGCGMGADRGSGAVSHAGEVFDANAAASTGVHKGLYVIDGAILPRSLGVNPLLTITALAERAMIHFGRTHGLAV